MHLNGRRSIVNAAIDMRDTSASHVLRPGLCKWMPMCIPLLKKGELSGRRVV